MSAQRMVFLMAGLVVFTGIFLSGYTTVHWLLYIPATVMLFAAITGICPGIVLFKKLGFK
ncbi:MAG: DUF2892 domain-containing protein [Gammaproteobacteria bacterium]|nr:DUF2892 domain-containing protein [Gammaproteobacteria bacterium]